MIFVPCTVNPCEVTIHMQKKKKVENVKRRNAGRRLSSQTLTLYHIYVFRKKIGNLTRSWIPTNTKLADMCVDIYM